MTPFYYQPDRMKFLCENHADFVNGLENKKKIVKQNQTCSYTFLYEPEKSFTSDISKVYYQIDVTSIFTCSERHEYPHERNYEITSVKWIASADVLIPVTNPVELVAVSNSFMYSKFKIVSCYTLEDFGFFSDEEEEADDYEPNEQQKVERYL
jgi:hypothetical protein